MSVDFAAVLNRRTPQTKAIAVFPALMAAGERLPLETPQVSMTTGKVYQADTLVTSLEELDVAITQTPGTQTPSDLIIFPFEQPRGADSFYAFLIIIRSPDGEKVITLGDENPDLLPMVNEWHQKIYGKPATTKANSEVYDVGTLLCYNGAKELVALLMDQWQDALSSEEFLRILLLVIRVCENNAMSLQKRDDAVADAQEAALLSREEFTAQIDRMQRQLDVEKQKHAEFGCAAEEREQALQAEIAELKQRIAALRNSLPAPSTPAPPADDDEPTKSAVVASLRRQADASASDASASDASSLSNTSVMSAAEVGEFKLVLGQLTVKYEKLKKDSESEKKRLRVERDEQKAKVVELQGFIIQLQQENAGLKELEVVNARLLQALGELRAELDRERSDQLDMRDFAHMRVMNQSTASYLGGMTPALNKFLTTARRGTGRRDSLGTELRKAGAARRPSQFAADFSMLVGDVDASMAVLPTAAADDEPSTPPRGAPPVVSRLVFQAPGDEDDQPASAVPGFKHSTFGDILFSLGSLCAALEEFWQRMINVGYETMVVEPMAQAAALARQLLSEFDKKWIAGELEIARLAMQTKADLLSTGKKFSVQEQQQAIVDEYCAKKTAAEGKREALQRVQAILKESAQQRANYPTAAESQAAFMIRVDRHLQACLDAKHATQSDLNKKSVMILGYLDEQLARMRRYFDDLLRNEITLRTQLLGEIFEQFNQHGMLSKGPKLQFGQVVTANPALEKQSAQLLQDLAAGLSAKHFEYIEAILAQLRSKADDSDCDATVDIQEKCRQVGAELICFRQMLEVYQQRFAPAPAADLNATSVSDQQLQSKVHRSIAEIQESVRASFVTNAENPLLQLLYACYQLQNGLHKTFGGFGDKIRADFRRIVQLENHHMAALQNPDVLTPDLLAKLSQVLRDFVGYGDNLLGKLLDAVEVAIERRPCSESDASTAAQRATQPYLGSLQGGLHAPQQRSSSASPGAADAAVFPPQQFGGAKF